MNILKEPVEYQNDQEKRRNDGAIQCKLCGFYAHELSAHIQWKHKEISALEYKRMFKCELTSEKAKQRKAERIKGNKNYFYQHNGKFSPWSKAFIQYKTTDDYDQNLTILKEKSHQTKQAHPENESTRIEYWIKKGLTEEQANAARKERQTTFSLQQCIKKYGEIKGTECWKQRQKKWLKTLDAKTDEEKKLINEKKISTGYNISKAEKELLKIFQENNIATETQYCLLGKNQKAYVYDFRLNKKIIEYFGDFWHANPQIYDSTFLNPISKKTFNAIQKSNNERIKFAEQNGYEILVIWENDFNKNKEETIQKCLSFLK